MNSSLILAVFVSILGYVLAMDNPNPECDDLENLRKVLTKAINKMKDSDVDCKLNSNCTGLQCNGKVRGKPFKGTVIVEGCQKPVGMLIHANGGRYNVTDGYKRTIMEKPVRLIVHINLEKKNNAVSVTVSLETCLLKHVPCLPPLTILKQQKIRVQCNGSEKKNQSNEHRNTSSGWSKPDDVRHLYPATNKPSNVNRSKIPQSDGKSLSVGAIVGVVIAVVVFFVILIAVIVWIVHGKRRRIQRYNDVTMNDDSDPLFFNSDPLV